MAHIFFAHKRPAQNKVSIYRNSILTQTSGLSQFSCYQNMETFFSNMAMLLGQVEKKKTLSLKTGLECLKESVR